MKILVIGAGATGGFFGGKLALAGRDVTFLVRERRADQLRRNGLVLRTPAGELRVQPKLLLAEELAGAGHFDLVLLSTKAYALEQAMTDMAPAIGPLTMVLPMLNGMHHFDLLIGRFGDHAVLGGSCRIVGDVDAEGRIVQMSSLGELAYGERTAERTPRIEAVHRELSGAGFDATLAPNILDFLWTKWVMLASTNAINAIARASIGDVAAVEELDGAGMRFMHRALAEAVAVATAHGYPPSEQSLDVIRSRVLERGSSFETSMYRDLKRGGAIEAFQIVGDMVARGREKGIDTPLLEAAYVQLRAYESLHGF